MATTLWLIIAGCIGGIALLCWRLIRKARERERSEAARFAAFMEARRDAAAAPAVPGAAAPAPPTPAAAAPAANPLATQKLLFDAARKAGDAGEPALAAEEARAAAEAQKKLIKA
jgi:hypothetical protein